MTDTDWLSLWTWPWTLLQGQIAALETLAAVPVVIGARLPTLHQALADPLAADHRELALMVSEKGKAFGLSQRSLARAARQIRAAGHANMRDAGRLAAGATLWPLDYWHMAERNLAAMAALVTLPGRALQPLHKAVKANARRLPARSRPRRMPPSIG